jgi:Lon protease-like protein
MQEIKIKNLPLFPLSVVLFPESFIKIHIFEEKYKTLFKDINSSDQLFGVSLSIEDKIYNIGCIAKIVNVLMVYEDGSVDVVVEGTQKFRLNSLINEEKPYLVGNIEYIEDIIEPFHLELQKETISLYEELIKVIYRGKIDSTRSVKSVKNISYKVAEKIGMTFLERQNLLEMISETERLKNIFEYLKNIIPRLENFNVMQSIVRNDGYM